MAKYVKNVITEYMIQNGYNALCGDYECGCSIDDLAPCDNCPLLCSFGVMVDCEHCNQIDTCEDSSIALGYDACKIAVPIGWCDKAVAVKSKD